MPAPRVALVSMPWAPISEPSLGLAILKAQLKREGVAARVFHGSLGLLRYVTGAAYQQIASCWGLNEFTFTGVLDSDVTDEQVACLMERAAAHTEVASTQAFRNASELGEAVIEMRHQIMPRYLAECAERILAYEPTMVGFTCMFDQTLASVALASLLRRANPELLLVLGGYALEGPPGLEVLRAFHDIDAVAVGDGEPTIAGLARASVKDCCLERIPGVITRASRGPVRRLQFDLRESAEPDYDDWYADLETLRLEDHVSVRTTVLPIESSRGCWWGQKHHCVFCGIDEATLKYRSKDADLIVQLLARMRERHGSHVPMRFSDYIFPHNFFAELLPRLAQVMPRYDLQCEIKANQTTERVKAFADAGFSELQPGIESFDTNVLRLMDKGVSGIQNVHLLRQGYMHGIQINYNILYGLPGEQAVWYERMVGQLPRLFHLTPPVTRTETIVTRFAPLQANPRRFGIDSTPTHHRCYDCLFSDDFLAATSFNLDNYAYYFERNFDYEREATPHYWSLLRQVDNWKRQHRERYVDLSWAASGSDVVVFDSRRTNEPVERRLSGADKDVFLTCMEKPMRRRALVDELDATDDQIEASVGALDRAGLIWTENDLVLGLAIPEGVVRAHRSRNWQQQWTALFA
jgi:ribosomal peptide maturation radical SAM protein 1